MNSVNNAASSLKLVISMPQCGGMSLEHMRNELRKRHAKVSGRKRELVERYVNGR